MRRFLGINIGSHEEKFNSIEFIDLFALILILFFLFILLFAYLAFHFSHSQLIIFLSIEPILRNKNMTYMVLPSNTHSLNLI